MDDIKYYFTGTHQVDGFYNSEDHSDIPDGAIEITKDERDAAIDAQSRGMALCISDGSITPHDYPEVKSEWDGDKWVSDITEHNNCVSKLRQLAYAAESDHLFFKQQRGEIPIGEWENKVAEIKERYPKA